MKLITTPISGTLTLNFITSLLKQNDDREATWALQILEAITNFNHVILEERQKELAKAQRMQRTQTRNQKKSI